MCKTFLTALAKHKRFQRLFLQVRLNKTENVQKNSRILQSEEWVDAQTIKLWILLLPSKMSEEFYDEAVNSIKSGLKSKILFQKGFAATILNDD